MPIRFASVFAPLVLFIVAVSLGPLRSAAAAPDGLILSEIMASGNDILSDEDGDYPDWIEIRNAGAEAVNLAGWRLTDDPAELSKWVFPPVTLPASGYVTVFASDKDRTGPDGPLHANFRLAAEGELLALVSPEGRVIDSFAPSYPSLEKSGGAVSYGAGQSGALGYFLLPTPGGPNGERVEGFAEPPVFGVQRGFYREPFSLALSSSTFGAEVFYTLDGSAPGPETGMLYSQPIRIETTTVVRAAAFGDGLAPSEPVSHTYIFLDKVIRQTRPEGFPRVWDNNIAADYEMDPEVVDDPRYRDTIINDLKSIPTISLSLDFEDLFGEARGIYMNPEQKGVEWERPASAEWIFPDGRPGFHVNHGLRVQGGFSRVPDRRKHSFRLLFKREYGPARLRFPVFPHSDVAEFDTLVLRGAYNYTWHHHEGGFNSNIGKAEYMRDEFSRRTQLALGVPASHGTYAHLYLNGLYWGVYNLCERPDDAFSADYLGGEKEQYDVVTGGTRNFYQTQVKAGSKQAWSRMMAVANTGDLSRGEHYDAIREYVDVDNLIDYMLVVYYTGNRDAPTIIGGGGTPWNFYSSRRQLPGSGFRFYVWDSEWTLEEPDRNVVEFHDGHDNPAHVFQRLKANPDFRALAADHIYHRFIHPGVFKAENSIARYLEIAAVIDRAIVGESARWGDARGGRPRTRDDDWLREVDRIVATHLPNRHNVVLDQLRAAGWYPPINAPEFNQHGGPVAPGFELELNKSAVPSAGNVALPTGALERTEIWYTLDGADPRAPGGEIAPSARRYAGPVPIEQSVLIRARARFEDQWSAMGRALFLADGRHSPNALIRDSLQITELMYNPPGDEEWEYLELFNRHESAAIPLHGLRFRDGVRFDFPFGAVLPPGGYALLSRSAKLDEFAAFRERYSLNRGDALMFGLYAGNLSNGGERIALETADGEPVFVFEYSDDAPWPGGADGSGASLQRISLERSAMDPANWTAAKPSPGRPTRPQTPVDAWRLHETVEPARR